MSSASNEDSIIRLVGAVLLEQNDEYQLQHRYMQIEGMAAPRHTNHRGGSAATDYTQGRLKMQPDGHTRIYTTLTDATAAVFARPFWCGLAPARKVEQTSRAQARFAARCSPSLVY
jgi:hypothetical protein